MNFTLAILLLIAFVGSGVFFVMVSNGLKLERVAAANPATEVSPPPGAETE